MKNIKKSYNTFTPKVSACYNKGKGRVICVIERIEKLTYLTLKGEMLVKPVKTEFNREDLLLDKTECEVKRLCEYILNQEPKITEYSCMTGFMAFDSSVVGDASNRAGYKVTQEALVRNFYLKPIDNLSTFEWQHATADYARVLSRGIKGIIEDIEASMKIHTDKKSVSFLNGLKKTAEAMILWAHKCSDRAREFAEGVENSEYKENLLKLSKALLHVPENKPVSFYEAVLTIYLCYSADPDSVGTLDRYLTPFYEADIKAGILTDDEAKSYLQELFLLLQAKTPINGNFTRGGESHFCIGGYLNNGEDGFNRVSSLIVESLLELPTYCPEITLRWTKKTPREVLRYVMDCERKDKFKRFAFTNDDKRIQCFTQNCGIPFERAVEYTMTGCNEPAFLGAITGSTSKGNLLHSVETLFYSMSDSLLELESFDEFYKLFESVLFSELDRIYDYDDKYNLLRSRDKSYISSLFFKDCIENAKSLTEGGGNTVIASPMLLGITNVIDSLIVVKQFVFDENVINMQTLVNALNANWEGYEELRQLILKKTCFFGNGDSLSDEVAQRLYESFYTHLTGKKNAFGYQWLIGDLLGYNEHHKWFGENTKATPDGRFSGEQIKFGIGQSEGKDRNGLTALLSSIARLDPHAIACGATVTNISLDEALVKDDDNFEKTVDMFETYFKNGGTHFQLTYVSKEELIAAQNDPEQYRNLRVRVTGFSDYFVRLKESIQKDIIERTEHHE